MSETLPTLETRAKPWFRSRGIVGALVALLALAADLSGLAPGPAVLEEAVALLGAGLALWGRLRADAAIAVPTIAVPSLRRPGGTPLAILLLPLLLVLAGCAGLTVAQHQRATGAQAHPEVRAFALATDFRTAQVAALAYVESPYADPAVVAEIQRLDREGLRVVKAAREAARAGVSPEATVALEAASAAIARLSDYVRAQSLTAALDASTDRLAPVAMPPTLPSPPSPGDR